jgi:hypothetical protein
MRLQEENGICEVLPTGPVDADTSCLSTAAAESTALLSGQPAQPVPIAISASTTSPVGSLR